jgi:hypothetical protein
MGSNSAWDLVDGEAGRGKHEESASGLVRTKQESIEEDISRAINRSKLCTLGDDTHIPSISECI